MIIHNESTRSEFLLLLTTMETGLFRRPTLKSSSESSVQNVCSTGERTLLTGQLFVRSSGRRRRVINRNRIGKGNDRTQREVLNIMNSTDVNVLIVITR